MLSQAIARFSGALSRRLLFLLGKRPFYLPDRGPIVSFTFDDFPRSALTNGATILKSFGACGTYYAAMGLMGQTNELGEHFRADDLERLLAEGHELGSHTFSHLSCRSTPFDVFDADVQKGCQSVTRVTENSDSSQFAYPHGHITLKAKGRLGAQMGSCRSTFGGVNVSPVDLNLLLANRLYDFTFDLSAVEHLFRVNDQRRGWLIFYTHDVGETPSRWGCKPGQLEAVVRIAVRMRHKILTVGAALGAIENPIFSPAYKHHPEGAEVGYRPG
ncbi:MAG TPA: polysaccharide deacetylase family protein [Terriglobia bacterium]|nr:polysaccharide deacetylase family protein [Terriglobia bacterium]